MTNAIATTNTLAGLLEKCRPEIDKVIPKHLTSERLTRLALSVVGRDDNLARCSPASVLRAVMDAAKLGLEPTGAVGGAYLVAYFNSKTGQHEAQLLTDYRGEMELVRRSGLVRSITCHVVHERDEFTLVYGDEERLVHLPALGADRGKPTGAYAIAHLNDGSKQRCYLSAEEIEHYRSKSRSSKHGPWVTDTLAMWRKTAIRRLCNMLPRSVEHAEQIEREESTELVVEPEQAPVQPALPAGERLLAKVSDPEMAAARERLTAATAELERRAGTETAAALIAEHVKSMRGVRTAEHVLERVEQVEGLIARWEARTILVDLYEQAAKALGRHNADTRIANEAKMAALALGDDGFGLFGLSGEEATEAVAGMTKLVASIAPREPGEDG